MLRNPCCMKYKAKVVPLLLLTLSYHIQPDSRLTAKHSTFLASNESMSGASSIPSLHYHNKTIPLQTRKYLQLLKVYADLNRSQQEQSSLFLQITNLHWNLSRARIPHLYRHVRRQNKLAIFNCKIEYPKGKKSILTDAISTSFNPTCGLTTYEQQMLSYSPLKLAQLNPELMQER